RRCTITEEDSSTGVPPGCRSRGPGLTVRRLGPDPSSPARLSLIWAGRVPADFKTAVGSRLVRLRAFWRGADSRAGGAARLQVSGRGLPQILISAARGLAGSCVSSDWCGHERAGGDPGHAQIDSVADV